LKSPIPIHPESRIFNRTARSSTQWHSTPTGFKRPNKSASAAEAASINPLPNPKGGMAMSDSVYKVIELVGTSSESWEYAARNAIESAGASLKDLRIAEVGKLDMKVEEGRVVAYRARVKLSFKYQAG
jgi:flavin-binding protein dodecin